jgi:hypothetical protein
VNARTYLLLSGLVFGAVAVLHLLRVVYGWEAVVGPWSVPMEVSWTGMIVPAVLCGWALRLASRPQP